MRMYMVRVSGVKCVLVFSAFVGLALAGSILLLVAWIHKQLLSPQLLTTAVQSSLYMQCVVMFYAASLASLFCMCLPFKSCPCH